MAQRFFVDGLVPEWDTFETDDDAERVAPFYIFDITTQSHLPREYATIDACRAVVLVLNSAYQEGVN